MPVFVTGTRCGVYCHTIMRLYGSDAPRTNWAIVEHLNHLPPGDDSTTIASCNASEGDFAHLLKVGIRSFLV